MITHTSDSLQTPSQKRQSQSYKFKKIAKISHFKILQETLYAVHILKLLDKNCRRYRADTGCGTDRVNPI